MSFSDLNSRIAACKCIALSPKQYVLGYENGIPQFITGRSKYRCVNFLSANINQICYNDLGASLSVELPKKRDLSAYINVAWKQVNYNLRGIIRGWAKESYYDLSVNIHCMVFENLQATLTGFTYSDLPVSIYVVPGVDLSAYLKIWPMKLLPANIHGWQEKDLAAYIDWNIKKDLPVYIGVHGWINLRARLRGWVREAEKNLSVFINGFAFENLSATIRSTYLEDLSAYLFSVEPKDLPTFIHGWDTKDLTASVVGKYGPYDLHGNISGHLPKDLSAYIYAAGYILPYKYDLKCLISGWYTKDLNAYVNAIIPANLGATLSAKGYSDNLSAFIYPKMIYLTTIISVETMEHLNLSATINFICKSSAFKNLSSHIRCTYLSNLTASITGYKIPNYSSDLSATIGYADAYINIDKLPLSISIGSGYQIEDKLPIYIKIYKQLAGLSAYIKGTPMYTSLGANLTPVWLQEYEFDNRKNREIVIHRDHSGHLDWYKVVEISFQSIVDEYVYIGSGNKVYKIDKIQRWKTDVKSYIPEDVKLNIRRKLFRTRTLYDLSKFNSIDEAVRFMIDYVTRENYGNLGSFITATGGFLNLSASIKSKYFRPADSDLSSSITIDERTYVVGFDNEIDIF